MLHAIGAAGRSGAVAAGDLNRLSLVARHTQDAIVITDRQGTIQWVNVPFTTLCGYTADDLIGRDVGSMINGPETDAEVVQRIQRATEAGTGCQEELLNYRKDGTPYWASITTSPVLDDRGVCTGFVGIERDVTERRRTAAALRSSEENYRRLVEAMPVGITVQEDGQVVYANPAAIRLFGGDEPGQIVGHAMTDLLHPDAREDTGTGDPTPRERRYVTLDGVELLLEVSTLPVSHEDRPAHLAVYRDITAQRRVEEALRISEDNNRRLIELSPDGILVRQDGRFVYANLAALQLLGAGAPEQVVGHSTLDFIHPEDRESSRADYSAVIATIGAGQAIDRAPRGRRCLRVDGSEFLVESTVSQVFHNGKPAILSVIRDGTERRRIEENLRQHAALLELAPVAIIARDLDDRVTFWSAGAHKLYGWSAEEARGQVIQQLLQTVFQTSSEEVADAVRGAGLWVGELHHRTRAGGEVIVASRQAVARDGAGKPTAILEVNTDVTERRRAEDALRESEVRLRAVLDHTPSIIFLKDLDGRYLLINHSFSRLLGPTQEQALGKTDSDLFPEHLAQAFQDNDRQVLQAGEACTFEEVAEQADGLHTSLVTKVPLRGEDGQPYALCGIVTDISDRKRFENQQALLLSQAQQSAESRAIYEAAAFNLTDGLMILDPSDTILSWNPRMSELYDVPAGDAIGRSFWAIIDPFYATTAQPDKTRQQSRAARDSALAGTPQDFDYVLAGTPERALSVRTFPIHAPGGQLLGYGRLVRDVTQEREVIRLKDDFVSMVSHELRTPMNGVIAMTDLLLCTALDAGQRESAETIRTSGRALVAIVNDILDVSRLQSGQVELEEIELDVRGVVEQVSELMIRSARDKGLEFVSCVDRAVPHQLYGDPGRLRQVLTNLVANAIKFTDRGEVSARISIASETPGEIVLRGEVIDTGIGIESEIVGHLFVPFRQADSSVTRRYGGTGLGLAISKQLAEAMGGEVGVSSQAGRGSTFWFTVKVRKPDAAQIAAQRLPAAAPAVFVRDDAPLVLIVDDVEVNRRVAERILAYLGYRTRTANSGLGALEILTRTECAAVLMDCRMPDMDGFAATAEIRRREGDDRHTPIIAMTAHAQNSDRERCLDGGMDDYLSKPVELAVLARVLEKWVPQVSTRGTTAVPAAVEVRREERVLDPGALSQIRALEEPGQPSLLAEMVETFRVSADVYLARLREALMVGDHETVLDAAHSLGGAAASLGAQQVRSIALALELRGRQQSLDGATEQLTALDNAFAQALAALTQEVARAA